MRDYDEPQSTEQVVNHARKVAHTTRRIRARCRQLFLLYQGWHGKLFFTPTTFFKKTKINDRNLLMFRDSLEQDYAYGISSDIPGFDNFLRWQLELCGIHFPHAIDKYCIGTSCGARAAIAYGYYLKVSTVWAFAPPPQTPRFRGRTLPASGEGQLPYLPSLLKTSNGVTEYRIYYNEKYDEDRRSAESLGHLPGVRLFPQPEDHHVVVATLDTLGELDTLLPSFEPIR